MRLIVLFTAVGSLALAGCGQKQLTTAPATTVTECAAQYEAAAAAGTDPTWRSGYQQCLARIGANVPQEVIDDPSLAKYLVPVGQTRASAQPEFSGESVYCVGGSSVLQGGAGYCIGF